MSVQMIAKHLDEEDFKSDLGDHALFDKNRSLVSQAGQVIKDVWYSNFFESMDEISRLVNDFPYIFMDTEFPGQVYVPANITNEFEYLMIKANCDNLKLIQVGIALQNEDGITPKGKTIAWQFNLKFDKDNDQIISGALNMLTQSDLDFDKHIHDGIPQQLFAQYLISSGLVLMPRNRWITFHGGYDLGYLLKLLMGRELPNSQDEFFDELDTYFINYYDTKELKRDLHTLISSNNLRGIAMELEVDRVGTMHQAGSDAQVTAGVYFDLKELLQQHYVVDSELKFIDRYNKKLYGLRESYNEGNYIQESMEQSKMHQYIDTTGYVNLIMKEQDNGQRSSSAKINYGPNQRQMYSNNQGSSHGMLNSSSGGSMPSMQNMAMAANVNQIRSPIDMQQRGHSSNQWQQNIQPQMMTAQSSGGSTQSPFNSSYQLNTPIDAQSFSPYSMVNPQQQQLDLMAQMNQMNQQTQMNQQQQQHLLFQQMQNSQLLSQQQVPQGEMDYARQQMVYQNAQNQPQNQQMYYQPMGYQQYQQQHMMAPENASDHAAQNLQQFPRSPQLMQQMMNDPRQNYLVQQQNNFMKHKQDR